MKLSVYKNNKLISSTPLFRRRFANLNYSLIANFARLEGIKRSRGAYHLQKIGLNRHVSLNRLTQKQRNQFMITASSLFVNN